MSRKCTESLNIDAFVILANLGQIKIQIQWKHGKEICTQPKYWVTTFIKTFGDSKKNVSIYNTKLQKQKAYLNPKLKIQKKFQHRK